MREISTGKSQVEYYPVGFSKRRRYLGVLNMPCTHKMKMSSCQHHPAPPEAWYNFKNIKNPIKIDCFPKKSSSEGNEGSVQERARLNTILCRGIFQNEKLFCPAFTKMKMSSCQQHPAPPEAWYNFKNINNPIEIDFFPSRVLWRELKRTWEK